MKKLYLILGLCFLSFIVVAEEPVLDFKDTALPVLNETLRMVQDDIRDLKVGVGTVATFASDDVTPDVSAAKTFYTQANSGATEITDLDNPNVGQDITIIGGSATNPSTISDSGNFKLSGSTWTATVDEVLILHIKADNYYIEKSRSTN